MPERREMRPAGEASPGRLVRLQEPPGLHLGRGGVVEAVAEDGQIEAISVKGAKAFAVGVQWHPEYHSKENPDYDLFITAFHNAVKDYQLSRYEWRATA